MVVTARQRSDDTEADWMTRIAMLTGHCGRQFPNRAERSFQAEQGRTRHTTERFLKLVYTAADPIQAEILKDFLASHGIECSVQGLFGWGGRGELAADHYPRIYVLRDQDYARARQLALQMENDHEPRPAWTCGACGESHTGHFLECWKCGASKDGLVAAQQSSQDS